MDRQVVITLADRRAGLDRRLTGQLEALSSVTHVLYEPGDLLTLRCGDTTATLDQTLALLREYDTAVRGIEVREPSLEDAFLAATGREFEESDPARAAS